MKKNFRILCAMGLVSSALLVACGNTSKVSETTKAVESSSEEATTEKTSEEQSKVYPFTIDSDTGNENVSVTFEEAPKKAVSLSGFTTEMLLSLGLEDSMVGYGYQDNEVLPEYKDALSKSFIFSLTAAISDFIFETISSALSLTLNIFPKLA